MGEEPRYEIRWMSFDGHHYLWHVEPDQLTRQQARKRIIALRRKGVDGVAFEVGKSEMVTVMEIR